MASPHAVLGIDSSERYIQFAHKQIKDPRVTFRVGDAQEVPVESASYDAAVSGLVLNFVPQPSQALKEMIRAVYVGGTVTAYVWDYAGQMQLMRYFWNTAVELDRTTAFTLDEGQRFPICQPEPLRRLFQIARSVRKGGDSLDRCCHHFPQFRRLLVPISGWPRSRSQLCCFAF